LRCSQSISALIRNLLDFSMLEAGRLELKPERFSLKSTISFLQKLLQARSLEKQVDLEWNVEVSNHEKNIYVPLSTQSNHFEAQSSTTDLDEESQSKSQMLVFGDWLRLEQVIINLVTNAIKFTPARHSISASLSLTHHNPKSPNSEHTVHFSKRKNRMENEEESDSENEDLNRFIPNSQQEKEEKEKEQQQQQQQHPHHPSQQQRPEHSKPGIFVDIVIADTGCGIPKEAHDRLFQAFFQVERNSHHGSG